MVVARGSAVEEPEEASKARRISRRRFLGGSGAGIALLAAGTLPLVKPGRAEASRSGVTDKGVLVDTTRCVGCNVCVEACKRKNGKPVRGTWPTDLSTESYSYIRKADSGVYYAKRQCMNCVDPACVAVCPVGAMTKSELGPVSYSAFKCFGCRYCEQACPFQVPRYTWDERFARVTKCNMCKDRVEAGLPTACAAACPFGALAFGDRTAMIEEAHRRIAANPGQYIDHVYGEHELGGTDFLYLSSRPFEELGLKEMPEEALPKHTWEDTVKMPWVMGGVVAILTAGYFATRHRGEAEAEEPQPEAAAPAETDEQEEQGR